MTNRYAKLEQQIADLEQRAGWSMAGPYRIPLVAMHPGESADEACMRQLGYIPQRERGIAVIMLEGITDDQIRRMPDDQLNDLVERLK